jgi:tetratricopeptide (TPR) repeat protein
LLGTGVVPTRPVIVSHPFAALLALSLCGATASPAFAQAPARRPVAEALSKDAKGEYDVGIKLLGLGEHTAALPHLKRALELSSDSRLLLPIAQAERGQGKLARAHRAVTRFLAESGVAEGDRSRKQADELLADLAPRVGKVVIVVSEPGAAVTVDDDLVGTTPLAPLVVERGTRKVRIEKAQFKPFERTDMVVGDATVSLSVTLEREPIPLAAALTGAAKDDYEAGRILYGDGDYSAAAVKFGAAHRASTDARLLWNIAVCEKNLRHYAKVLGLVERYLSEGKGVVTSQDRVEAEELVRVVRAFVTPLRIRSSEAGAAVFVDDEEVGTTPLAAPVVVDVGARKLRVTKDEFKTWTSTVTVSGAEPMDVDVTLTVVRHEGRLVVAVSEHDTVVVDGKIVGVGHWEGILPSGAHALRVTRDGMRPFQSDVAITDNETRRLQVSLEAEPSSSKAWLWVSGGVLVAAGLGVGGYVLLRPQNNSAPPTQPGTMPPGSVQLSFRLGGAR